MGCCKRISEREVYIDKHIQKQEKSQTHLMFPWTRKFLFNVVLEVLARIISQENERYAYLLGRSKIFSVCRWQTLLKTVKTNKFSKIAAYKMNIQKMIAFLYTNNTLPERN